MKKVILLLAFVFLLTPSARAQTNCPAYTAGVLASSRIQDWCINSGLPSSLAADGSLLPMVSGSGTGPYLPPARSTICSTISSGATVATINTAISSCTAGQTVKLPCDNSITNVAATTLKMATGVTVRGCGADKTTIYMPGAGGISWQGSIGQPTCTWSAGYSAGTTTLTASCSPAVGTVLWLSANGQTYDTGVDFICALVGICSEFAGTNARYQNVIVTGVSGSGPYSVSISPALYANFDSPFTSPLITENTGEVSAAGLEDLTVDCTGTSSTSCLYMGYTHYAWMKGVRIVGAHVGNQQLGLNTSFRDLVMNCYFFTLTTLNSNTEQVYVQNDSDDLFINNIFQAGFGVYLQSPSMGEVFAYNYFPNGSGSTISGGAYLNNIIVGHGVDSFTLLEGDEVGAFQDDFIHSTHDFNTVFRTIAWGNDPPFTIAHSTAALSLEGYSRFNNLVGNVLGYTGIQSKYKSTPASNGGTPVINSGVLNGYTGYPYPQDIIADASNMFWGNYDIVTNAVRWCGNSSDTGWGTTCSSTSEVPASLNAAAGYQQTLSGSGSGPYTATLSHTPCIYGSEILFVGTATYGYDLTLDGTITGTGITSGTVNCTTGAVSITFTGTPGSTPTVNYDQQTGSASAYRNSVPATETLPPSFLLPIASAHPSGGTNLAWWKVCTNYTTGGGCGGSYQTQPFPPIGPDVSSGPQVNGSYDNAAGVAWTKLPIDSTYQTTYSVTASSWSAGTETLTVSINATYYPIGEFQIKGTPACNGAFLITASSATQVQYALASDPGTNACNGTNNLAYPDVRTFNEDVYSLDSTAQADTPTFNPGGESHSGALTVTMSSTSGTVICHGTGSSPATNGDGSTCATGTPITTNSGTNCVASSTVCGDITVSTTQTQYAVAGSASLTDSGIQSATYTILSASQAGGVASGVGLASGTAIKPYQ